MSCAIRKRCRFEPQSQQHRQHAACDENQHRTAQLFTEGCALADGQIDRAGSVLDEAEFLRHLCKGKLAAPDAPEKGIQNAVLVHGVGAAQVGKLVEVELNGPGRVQCVLMPGGKSASQLLIPAVTAG